MAKRQARHVLGLPLVAFLQTARHRSLCISFPVIPLGQAPSLPVLFRLSRRPSLLIFRDSFERSHFPQTVGCRNKRGKSLEHVLLMSRCHRYLSHVSNQKRMTAIKTKRQPCQEETKHSSGIPSHQVQRAPLQRSLLKLRVKAKAVGLTTSWPAMEGTPWKPLQTLVRQFCRLCQLVQSRLVGGCKLSAA